jgi:hypothetical protein
VSQSTKPEANGKAIRWHGYVAREGFGITRIKNHISDTRPAMGNIHINQRYFILLFKDLPVLGHKWSLFLFGDCICLPPNALLCFLSPNEQINQDRERNLNSVKVRFLS